jgi:hypothetical protein
MTRNLMNQVFPADLGELSRPDFDIVAFHERLKYSDEHPYFDMTQTYHRLGGTKSREILVLSSPSYYFSPNEVYNAKAPSSKPYYYKNHPENVELLNANFNFERLVEKIKDINPDILLLDLGITATVPDNERSKLKIIYNKKAKVPKELIHYPLDKECPSVFSGPLVEFSPEDLKEREHHLDLDYLLDCAGGVVLGHYLKQEGIPFRLWTGDYGHGRANLILSHVFDLVTTEEINDFMTVYAKRLLNEKTRDDYFGFFSNSTKTILCGLKNRFGINKNDAHKDFFRGDTSSINLILEGMD